MIDCSRRSPARTTGRFQACRLRGWRRVQGSWFEGQGQGSRFRPAITFGADGGRLVRPRPACRPDRRWCAGANDHSRLLPWTRPPGFNRYRCSPRTSTNTITSYLLFRRGTIDGKKNFITSDRIGGGVSNAVDEFESVPITLEVNGQTVKTFVEPRDLLVYFLRETLRLTGTHVGCDTSQCGACTVVMNGRAVKSCTVLAVQANGAEVTTIEGLAPEGKLHPLQAAFREKHGAQCGYCTPGMIMTAVNFLKTHPSPDEAEIRHALEGNLCRCTGYVNIVEAIQWAAARMS